jgi:hypothetical protein
MLLPFVVVAVLKYFSLRRQLIVGRHVVRIIDFWRAVSKVQFGVAAMCALLAACYIVILINDKHHSDSFVTISFSLFLICGIAIAIRTGQAFAVGLIGVVLDKDENTISFPTDGILRSFTSLRVVMDAIIPASMETLPISSIRSFNRQAGKTLIIHGDFGSRAITFSDKLRRDQLLSCLSGYRRYNDLELAGAGDYA